MASYFIVVASRDHAKTAEEGGFIQVGHGKKRPLKRLSKGDGVVCYSPKMFFGENKKCQRFTILGFVSDHEVYQVEMSKDFMPYRVDVDFENCKETEIRPLLEDLSFIKNVKSWGAQFRYGFFEIPERDFQLIRDNMACEKTV